MSLIKRHFTKDLEGTTKTVHDLFQWKKVSVKLADHKRGKVLFDKDDLEFPEHYSQMACDIIASKYFRMAGVPNGRGHEYSLKEVVHRMTDFWVKASISSGLVNEEEAKILCDELSYIMFAQMWAPNSPQWFNTGLKSSYNIDKESEGNFYFDTEQGKVVMSKDAYTRTAGSACFINSVEDSLLGDRSLTDLIATETRLFKQGAGTGSNFSNIRGIGEKLSGGGTSSGLLSFLKVFDRNAGAIKSGGTTRRAAKIVCLDADHPEIFEYMTWKKKEEDKVRALAKMGYSADFDGEAYETVSGQNSNNSVRLTDSFMRKISGKDKNRDFTLTGRKDPKINRTVDAMHLWDTLNEAAWSCGDPATQYDDTINAWHTCPGGENGDTRAKENRINASNPCSEFMFLDDTACNLASINVVKFYDETADEFDIEGLKQCVVLGQVALEATIHWGQFPTAEIARKSHVFRPTGLGIANTGTLHMIMAHPYNSRNARAIAAALMGIVTGQSYVTSAWMAERLGPFEAYNVNKVHMLRVVENHARVVREHPPLHLPYRPALLDHAALESLKKVDLILALDKIWENAVFQGEKHGFRNAQVTVIAPTGTISLAMDCGSTSIEPYFAHVVHKKLSGGGYLEMVNPAIEKALVRLGYDASQIADIVGYVLRKKKEDGFERIIDGEIEGAPHLRREHLPIFDTANQCGTGERHISPMGHVLMTAALTPLVSGAISKTVNLPNSATVKDFKEVNLEAWALGVKSISLYRDGCKAAQPLNSAIQGKKDRLEDLTYAELLVYKAKPETKELPNPTRNRPSGIRPARVHEAHIEGLKLYVNVTFYPDGRIAEIYIDADREGTIIKGLLDSLSKMVSKMLQYNIPAEDIARSLKGQKYEPHGFVQGHPYIKMTDSLSDLISKVIEIELGDFSSCQAKPEEGTFLTQRQLFEITQGKAPSPRKVSAEPSAPAPQIGEAKRVYGKTCGNCAGTKMAKNGTCYICLDCGTTTGCS